MLNDRIKAEMDQSATVAALAEERRESEKVSGQSRRYRRYAVLAELLVNLGQGSYKVIKNELPKDVHVVNAQFNTEKGWFELLLWSASFDPVLMGHVIPYTEIPWVEVIRE